MRVDINHSGGDDVGSEEDFKWTRRRWRLGLGLALWELGGLELDPRPRETPRGASRFFSHTVGQLARS